MLIDIDEIIVDDRIRKDFGDIEELADNIRKNGLLNPLTVNGDYKLLAGERRLRACRLLGWNQVDVRVVKSDDEAQDLEIEMSENNLRRNFTGSELAEGIRRQMALESEKAKERQQATQFGSDGGANIGTTAGKSRDKAAEQFGISGEQARKTLYVDDHRDLLDPADFAEWDEGKLSTNKAFQKIKAAQKQAEEGKAKAERELRLAEQERDTAKRDLAEAYKDSDNLEAENESLRRQLESVEHPKPEVIEREVEVVKEVIPSDYEAMKRRVSELEQRERMHSEDNRNLRKQLEDSNSELGKAREILGMDENLLDVRRDAKYLVSATNSYMRQYGGLAWTVEQLADVDEDTRDQLKKAATNMAAFATAMVNSLEEFNGR